MDQIRPGLLHKTSKAAKRLGSDRDGVASYEYVIVAALIIVVVGAAFSQTGPIKTALTGAINTLGTAITGG